jgi:hypothetical protein
LYIANVQMCYNKLYRQEKQWRVRNECVQIHDRYPAKV